MQIADTHLQHESTPVKGENSDEKPLANPLVLNPKAWLLVLGALFNILIGPGKEWPWRFRLLASGVWDWIQSDFYRVRGYSRIFYGRLLKFIARKLLAALIYWRNLPGQTSEERGLWLFIISRTHQLGSFRRLWWKTQIALGFYGILEISIEGQEEKSPKIVRIPASVWRSQQAHYRRTGETIKDVVMRRCDALRAGKAVMA